MNEGREGKGGDDRGAEREVGVHDGSVLRLSVQGGGSVKTGPEHPEEDGADHGEEIRGVSGTLLFRCWTHWVCTRHGRRPGRSRRRMRERRLSLRRPQPEDEFYKAAILKALTQFPLIHTFSTIFLPNPNG